MPTYRVSPFRGGMAFNVSDSGAPRGTVVLADNVLPRPLGAYTTRTGRQRRHGSLSEFGSGECYDVYRWFSGDAGGWYDIVYYKDGSDAKYSTHTGGTVGNTVTMSSDAGTRSIGMMAKLRAYLCNGSGDCKVYVYDSGVQTRSVGLTGAPACTAVVQATGGTDNLDGTYTYKLTVVYGDDGETNGGTVSADVIATDDKADLSWTDPTPAKGHSISAVKIWRKKSTATNWFYVDEVAGGIQAYEDNIADATVAAAAQLHDNYNSPPSGLHGMVWWDYENRALAWDSTGATRNRVHMSERGQPEVFKTADDSLDSDNTAEYIDVPQADIANEVITIVIRDAFAYVFNRYGVRAIVPDGTDYKVVNVENSQDHGILGARAVTVSDAGEIYYVSTSGLRVIRGFVDVPVQTASNTGTQDVATQQRGVQVGTDNDDIILGIQRGNWKDVACVFFQDMLHIACATDAVSGNTPTANNDVLIYDLRSRQFCYSSDRNVNGWAVQNDSATDYTLVSAASDAGMIYNEYVSGQTADEDKTGTDQSFTWKIEDFNRPIVGMETTALLERLHLDAASSSGTITMKLDLDGSRVSASKQFSYSTTGTRVWHGTAYMDCTPHADFDTVAEWNAVTDGEFRITIDGTTADVGSGDIDFSSAADMAGVASVLQVAIRAADAAFTAVRVGWVETSGTTPFGYFRINSMDVTASSDVTTMTTHSSPTGTDISGAGYWATKAETDVTAVSAGNTGLFYWGPSVSDPADTKYFYSAGSGSRVEPLYKSFNGERCKLCKITLTGTASMTVYGYSLSFDTADAMAGGVM